MLSTRDRMGFGLFVGAVTLLRPTNWLYPRLWNLLFGFAVHGAALQGSQPLVRYLLWLSPDVETKESITHSTPLMSAAHDGHTQLVKYLSARGADVNAKNDFGQNALFLSTYFGHYETTKFLLDSGADVHVTDVTGSTAFIEAAKKGSTEIMQLLLDRGADMLATGRGSTDALIWAAMKGNVSTVEFLIERGMSVEGKQGHRALQLAAHLGRDGTVAVLRQSGATE